MGSALLHSTNLKPFQIEKFTYMFNQLFDLEKNNLIELNDMEALAEKMRVYAGWTKEDPNYKSILDVMRVFYECLVDQVQAEKDASAADEVIPTWGEALVHKEKPITSISLAQWLNMWGRLCFGAAGLSDFPCWVQLLPSIFFRVIDVDKDDYLSQEEYTRFYRDFVGIDEKLLDKVVSEGYRAMTANGEYVLTKDNFNFVFANFLLGTTIYGPGKYIFGVFDNRDVDHKYEVIYNTDDEEE